MGYTKMGYTFESVSYTHLDVYKRKVPIVRVAKFTHLITGPTIMYLKN